MTGRPEGAVEPAAARADGDPSVARRRFIAAAGLSVVASLSGCSGGGDGGGAAADVVAGPEGRLAFEPETLSVAAGAAVTWYFDSAGHNVCGRPGDSDLVQLPDDAEPYATYGPDESPFATLQRGETYEHRFPVPGTYVYTCVPHERSGMVGRVEVEA